MSRVIRMIRGKFNIGTILILFCLLMVIISPDFRRPSNMANIAQQSAVLAVIALGQTWVILLGGIDLSVGSVAAFSGAIAASAMSAWGMDPSLALLLAVAIGAALGALNGALVVAGRLQPFVATLATMAVARGATLVYTQGAPIAASDPGFTVIAGGSIAGIPFPAIIALLLFVVAFFVLRHTRYGLHLYAVGGNSNSARLAGIRCNSITVSAYVISGACAAIGGVLLTARLWSAQPTAAVGLELESIAAVVLGGASLFGGVGGVGNTLIGALMIGSLSNAMNLLVISAYVQRVIRSVILIGAVALDIWARKRKSAAP